MTDTDHTSGLLEGLDRAEREHAAAFALARRLLADQQDRPIKRIAIEHLYDNAVQVGIQTTSRFGTRDMDAASAIAAWASYLGVSVRPEALSQDSDADVLHCFAAGALDGIKVQVWAAVSVPITDVVITSVRKRRRITYQQGAQTYSYVVADQDAADRWVLDNVRTAASPTAEPSAMAAPVTAAAIVSNSTGWHVTYRQDGEIKSEPHPSKESAQHWIAEHGPKRVPA
ncbi:hypothetical protein [Streptacidiphilus sp. EB103A]|uniref:hypothetical protein n=1 Tax=Streptacidiphilus sp. EB103A TaxID=3156275 RepID=UPI0035132528